MRLCPHRRAGWGRYRLPRLEALVEQRFSGQTAALPHRIGSGFGSLEWWKR